MQDQAMRERLIIRVTAQEHERLRGAAEANGSTLSETVRKFIGLLPPSQKEGERVQLDAEGRSR